MKQASEFVGLACLPLYACLSVCLFVSLSVYPSVRQSARLFVSLYLSLCRSVGLGCLSCVSSLLLTLCPM